MATQFPSIDPKLRRFIEKQHVFFTGTAAPDGRVNVSPKGMDSLRVVGPNRIIWRNLTVSGNETAVHLDAIPRMTLMWCAFAGPPMILRVFGQARAVHRLDPDWSGLDGHFATDPAARQIFDLDVELVQTSCGYAVPEMDYRADRQILTDWAARKGEDGLRAYWAERNTESIDGKPTRIVERNLGEN